MKKKKKSVNFAVKHIAGGNNLAKKDFHNLKFDRGTISKLEVFKEYFKESFPVFLHSPYFDEIYVYDFFAGQGKNSNNEYGTAFHILEEIKPYCEEIRRSNKKVYLVFNDNKESEILGSNISEFLCYCQRNCDIECVFVKGKNLIVKKENFESYFSIIYPAMLNKRKAAKLLYLDPFKFIIDSKLFERLINIPFADFICFMPSFFLRRFPELPTFKNYIDTSKIDYKESIPEHCHRVIADYFKAIIPMDREYYIGSFSIKKDSGYYGLLFGSSHTLGAEKFQKVCWKIDKITGEADYNIDRELIYGYQDVLFEEEKTPKKIKQFNIDLENQINSGKILTDIDAYKFALKNRCLVKHSADLLKRLMKDKKIEVFKTYNNDIHKIKQPKTIKRLDNET